jgi:tetratricopeptide (TPR) repeat protein
LAVVGAAGIVLAGWSVWRTPNQRRTDDSRAAVSGDKASDRFESPRDNFEWRTQPEFVGSQACRKCHPDHFGSFLETAHSRSLVEVIPDSEPPDAEFDDSATGRRYRTSHSNGLLVHEVCSLREDGTEVPQSRFPAKYRFGSGHFGRGYLVVTNGFFVESPISWFESRSAWAISPGFEGPDRHPFGRVVPEGCLLCHCGQVDRSTVSDLRMRIVETAIGCERCHGPGRAHVEQEESGSANGQAVPRGIVNPANLSRKLSEAICHQCHLNGDIKVPGRDIHAESFLPGEPLEKYRQEYLIQKPRTAMPVVGHVGQLARSACYQKSDTLKCVTCHNPHAHVAAENRAEHYRNVCLACHEDQACRLGLPERKEQKQNDCTACHMPGQPTDMPHVAFTHHQIGKHPVPTETAPVDSLDRLVPLSDLSALSEGDRQRSQGLAWQELVISPKAGRMTRSELFQIWVRAEKMLTTLPREFVDPVVELGLARLYFVRGQKAEAEAAARRVLQFDNLGTEPQIGALAIVADACREQFRIAEAAGYFAELTRLRRNGQDWFYLGACEYELHHVEAALQALNMARVVDPDAAEPCTLLATIYREKKDLPSEKRLREEADRLALRKLTAE